MIEFLELFFFGIEGVQKGIAPLAIAALGFATSGGLDGIIGGGKRREEEATAKRKQAQAESDYFNFDFDQDVGGIKNIYAEQTQQTQEYLTSQTNQQSANQLDALNRSGKFGASQAILQQRNQAQRANAQQISGLRTQGAAYVDQQRQNRLAQRYDQAGTLLGRADYRLAAAKRARQQATQAVAKGIGAGLTAGAGAAASQGFGLKGFDWKEGLKASGLTPNFDQ